MKKMNRLPNTLTLIIFLMGSIITSTGWAQLNPPQNLAYTVENENDVILYWNQPESDSALLHWDSGNNDDSWGFFLNPEEYSCAIKWDPEHIASYDGWLIKKMRIYVVNNAPTTVQLKIWSGPDATEIYSQDITTYNANAWTEIILDTPVAIDASTQLWAGLYIDMPTTGTFMGIDEGPVIDGYGNLYNWNGEWRHDQVAGNWNIQLLLEPPVEPTYLHWDSGINDDFFGFFLSGSYQFSCAAKWNPEHITTYDGWDITSIRFFLSDAAITELQLKIWTGPDGVEVYSQDVNLDDVNINEWTEITLDTPFPIDASTELWGGIYIDMPSPGAPVGIDEGPLVEGQGFWLHYQDQWYDANEANSNDNMNLQLGVEEPANRNGSRSMLGFNVYRNDVILNTDPISPTVYVDENLYNGTYNYYVTAVYDEGESDPSNTVTVIIDAPVVIEQDSLALVDLYNSCGGPNWNNNDEWLTGPINEWYGVTTTGTRVTRLWLQLNNLSGSLPASIGDLTGLEELHLESNNITSIPEEIGSLTAMTEFWIGWNPLTSVPESFGNLSSLEQVHLGFTTLGSLPETFGNLTNLDWLALGDAALNSLPQSFGNLTSLKTCFIWGNNLTELPENIGECVNMKYFNMKDNQITSLPESFGNMTQLYELWADNNLLTELPESFGNLESLFYLHINNNLLSSLPENFGNLSNLSHLYAYNNQLTELPASFGNLSSLDSVYLVNNIIMSLPDNWGDLDDLNLMDLSYNQLNELPESLSDMDSIQEIYLDVNQLSALPASFTNLSTLIKASFAINQITAIPDDIGTMDGLQVLNFNQNKIDAVPESMGDMSGLNALGLSYNQLDDLPDSFGNLTVSVLILNHNNLDKLPSGLLDNEFSFLYIQDNAMQFGTMEPLMGNVETFEYAPQDYIGTDTTLAVDWGADLYYTIEVSGEYNIYKWYKDGTLLPDQNTNTLFISSVGYDDMGTYVLKVTNSIVPDLELISRNVVFGIITGFEENEAPGFSLYPNPVSTSTMTISFEDPQSIESIAIFSMSGQLVYSESNIGRKLSLDVSKFGKGLYIMKASHTNGQITSEKFIVR